MYLLYLDDSGSAQNKNEQYLVLAGVCVFERQTYYLSRELDALAVTLAPQSPESVAYAVFRRYESGDTNYLDLILPKFDCDSDTGKIHGLVHKQTVNPNCMCPACLSRKLQ